MVKKILVSLILLLSFVLSFSVVKPTRIVKAENYDRAPGKILVKFRSGTSAQEIDRQVRNFSGKMKNRVDLIDVFVLKVPQGSEERILNTLSKNPLVEYAEPDYVASALSNPNDPYFNNQWGLENVGQIINGVTGKIDADIDASAAWDVTLGGVKVAILDTGIDQDHEDLLGKIVLQKNFTTSNTIDDLYGHGTHVSGIVAAVTDNGTGISGGCPNCALMNGKVLDDNGYGAYSWIASGIIWAADNEAKVINLSLGSSKSSKTLENAVNYAWNKGVIVVAAVGNSANPSKTYPAAYTKAVAVAATNNLDQKAYFSSYGARWVDVAAPGENIFSTFPNHTYKINKSFGYDFGSGTSMATPMASAVAALIWSTPYGTSAANVRSRLEKTAERISGTGTYWYYGRINAASAVAP